MMKHDDLSEAEWEDRNCQIYTGKESNIGHFTVLRVEKMYLDGNCALNYVEMSLWFVGFTFMMIEALFAYHWIYERTNISQITINVFSSVCASTIAHHTLSKLLSSLNICTKMYLKVSKCVRKHVALFTLFLK